MKNSFIISEAHSGTSQSEINKAKRFFNDQQNKKATWGETYSEPVQIKFDDTNYKITARYFNVVGQEICQPCGINH